MVRHDRDVFQKIAVCQKQISMRALKMAPSAPGRGVITFGNASNTYVEPGLFFKVCDGLSPKRARYSAAKRPKLTKPRDKAACFINFGGSCGHKMFSRAIVRRCARR